MRPVELPARRGFSISYRGKTLLSRIDPVAQAERLAAEIPVKERTLYFCPSPLYGYGLSLLLERLRNEAGGKNSAVLCVEADEQLFEISQNSRREQGWNDGTPLALVSVPEQLCAFVRKTWGERQFRRVEMIHLTGGWQLFPQLYENLANALRRELAVEWGNAMTLIRLGRLYARNLIRNLALLPEAENIAALDFGSSPVLALGAGPSLDPLLDGLSAFFGGKTRPHANRYSAEGNFPGPGKRPFKIVCVDTCLPALHERSILPDLVVILESQHWNLRDFSGARGRKIDAALDLSALPASGRVLGGKRFCFATPWTELALFKRLGDAFLLPEIFPPLGSVGLSAVALALRAGSGPVLSGGIDFSYTLDAYHARSTPGYGDIERRQNRLRSIINAGAAFREGSFAALSKSGETVRSDPAMRNYRNLFEQEFGGKANADSRLMDITGPGLPLGVKTVTLAQAFAILFCKDKAAPPAVRASASIPPGVSSPREKREKTAAFIRGETDALKTLRDMLSGAIPLEPARLDGLLDSADYLWAHFPECAGLGRPPASDLGFLKRVRAETDPFLKCWEMALEEITNFT